MEYKGDGGGLGGGGDREEKDPKNTKQLYIKHNSFAQRCYSKTVKKRRHMSGRRGAVHTE